MNSQVIGILHYTRLLTLMLYVRGLRRVLTPELIRGVFDGAMRVYLNRFLNVPAVHFQRRQ